MMFWQSVTSAEEGSWNFGVRLLLLWKISRNYRNFDRTDWPLRWQGSSLGCNTWLKHDRTNLTLSEEKSKRKRTYPHTCMVVVWCLHLPPPPPPPPTTLIPHIEVGFKWMWTQLATSNKMALVFVDLCAGLVVLLPRQICRFRHGFFSSAVLD